MGLLWILASESGKTFGRGELVRRVWGQNVFVTPRTVDVHIASLRKKLGSLCRETLRIETVWGIGYRLRHPD
jgi:DNA-binding response OmpR family regulator